MTGKTDIHPDAVLESLLAKGGRSNRRANLAKMHELCCKQHAAGSRDFSLPTIGRLDGHRQDVGKQA
nr:gamma-mobile-trio protein GmtX [uncultured Ralstonia sp.]